jgi:hypothetical protein
VGVRGKGELSSPGVIGGPASCERYSPASLGELPSAESRAILTPYLTTAGLKEEARVAAAAIAEKIVASHPAEVAAAMKQVQTNNPQLAARVRKLLARAQVPEH